jgi:two-component system response regulator YesN
MGPEPKSPSPSRWKEAGVLVEPLLKIMIIDDEFLVRDLLKRCLHWEQLGFQIAEEAASAREALELISREPPDIIITDICMPVMDGIELSRIVREQFPQTKIVILTGHEEFEYAKRSIQIGVSEFLLKPIRDDELQKIILKVRAEILAERLERDELNRLKQQLAENLPYLREKFFNELICPGTYETDLGERLRYFQGETDLGERLRYFQIEFGSGRFQTAVIEIEAKELHPNLINAEGFLLQAMKAQDLVKEYFNACVHATAPRIYIFFDYHQRLVILNNDPAVDLAQSAESLKTILLNRLHCFITIGIGKSYPDLGSIWYSYQEAVEAIKYKVLIGKDQVIGYDDLRIIDFGESRFEHQETGELAFYIKTGLVEKATEYIDLLFKTMDILTVDSLRARAFLVVADILNSLAGLKIDSRDILGTGGQTYEQIFNIDTLPEMKNYLEELVRSTIKTVMNLRQKKEFSVIKAIQEYMVGNLSNENLSLTLVAKEFYLNSSYLSRIFKQATGQTFVEFLTEIRMEAAIRLLRETDKKAYLIGQEVGIPDPHYFGICFKKYTGMAINDFRKS